MISLFIILQAQGSTSYLNMLFLVGIFVVFYFFMIRPQQKKQKEQKAFRENLKKGDDVVTIGGMHGKISAIEGNLITLDVDRGTKLTFDRSAISAPSVDGAEKK